MCSELLEASDAGMHVSHGKFSDIGVGCGRRARWERGYGRKRGRERGDRAEAAERRLPEGLDLEERGFIGNS